MTSFGVVYLFPGFHSEEFIFPPGYRCTHSRFVRVLAKQVPRRHINSVLIDENDTRLRIVSDARCAFMYRGEGAVQS